MKLLIIEDEPLAAERLQRIVAEVDPSLEVTGTCRSVQSAVEYLQQHPAPDLLLLDIELGDGQCFEIFRQVEVTSFVIFTTSYNEYAFKAFETHSIDYLLKPIRRPDLQRALDKFRSLQQRVLATVAPDRLESLAAEINRTSPAPEYRKDFLIRQGQRYIPVRTDDIALFYVDQRLTRLLTWRGVKLSISYTLEELEDLLDPAQFYRANRAFLVHKKAITRIRPATNGKLQLLLHPAPDRDVLVSKEKAPDFKKWMGR
ncbi:MAG TPA: LytTR family DNA-binding domain-containing protein [Chitinophagaceae bacterium]|nr:LytTR family DNA-binding domain-containing protein [Chitinophagaceae bacterium]